jgi:hypothetical protein
MIVKFKCLHQTRDLIIGEVVGNLIKTRFFLLVIERKCAPKQKNNRASKNLSKALHHTCDFVSSFNWYRVRWYTVLQIKLKNNRMKVDESFYKKKDSLNVIGDSALLFVSCSFVTYATSSAAVNQ